MKLKSTCYLKFSYFTMVRPPLIFHWLQVIGNLTSAKSYLDFFSKEAEQKLMVSLWTLTVAYFIKFYHIIISINFSRNWKKPKWKWNFSKKSIHYLNHPLISKIGVSYHLCPVMLPAPDVAFLTVKMIYSSYFRRGENYFLTLLYKTKSSFSTC